MIEVEKVRCFKISFESLKDKQERISKKFDLSSEGLDAKIEDRSVAIHNLSILNVWRTEFKEKKMSDLVMAERNECVVVVDF